MRIASHVRWFAALPLIGALATCSPVTGTESEGGLTFRRLETPHFIFLYTSFDAASMDQLTTDMDSMLVRLKGVLEVDSVPVFTVVLYPDRRSFQEANNSSTWVTGVTRGNDRMEIVSPFAPNQVFDLWPDTRVEHMLAHLVSRAVNDEIANNPRWLWESFALYESGQKTAVGIIPFFAPGAEPALSQLNGGFGTPIIDVGYYLGEFMEATWGTSVFTDLIAAGGNLPATLGITGDQFIAQFVAFVRAKYGLPS